MIDDEIEDVEKIALLSPENVKELYVTWKTLEDLDKRRGLENYSESVLMENVVLERRYGKVLERYFGLSEGEEVSDPLDKLFAKYMDGYKTCEKSVDVARKRLIRYFDGSEVGLAGKCLSQLFEEEENGFSSDNAVYVGV